MSSASPCPTDRFRLRGLVPATHTPFATDGELALDVVERQAAHLVRHGIGTVFVGGSTGESQSLTVPERLELARRWSEVVRGTSLRLVIHVGANCLRDAATLARQAEAIGADAISALAPSYFKPRSIEALAESMAAIAAAAPATPFYYYDIPQLTGIPLAVPEFLERAASRVPSLAGVKFSGSDLLAYQHALRIDGGRFDVPFGTDEWLLAALALGAEGAVGSSYNFAAAISTRLWRAFEAGDLATARAEQWKSGRLIQLLSGCGYMAAAKALMDMLGVPVGPPRLPTTALDAGQQRALRERLDAEDAWAWLEPSLER